MKRENYWFLLYSVISVDNKQIYHNLHWEGLPLQDFYIFVDYCLPGQYLDLMKVLLFHLQCHQFPNPYFSFPCFRNNSNSFHFPHYPQPWSGGQERRLVMNIDTIDSIENMSTIVFTLTIVDWVFILNLIVLKCFLYWKNVSIYI